MLGDDAAPWVIGSAAGQFSDGIYSDRLLRPGFRSLVRWVWRFGANETDRGARSLSSAFSAGGGSEASLAGAYAVS